MECKFCFSDLVSFFSMIATFVALYIACLANKNQMKILVLNQLSEKAKEANNWILPKTTINLDDFIQLSQIVSSIIVAIQLMDDTLKKDAKWLMQFSKQDCLDQFYLQLNAQIKDFIAIKKEESLARIQKYGDLNLIQQFNDASGNLEKSHEKYTFKK